MTQKQFMEARDAVLRLAHAVVDEEHYPKLVHALLDVERHAVQDRCRMEEVIRHMLSVITDGLSYGNWPWVRV